MTTTGALISAETLAAQLSDPGLRVVEVDVSPAAHNEWHIHGAVLWNIYAHLKDAEYRPVDDAAVEELLRRSGIEPESRVVFYGYAPAFGYWLLKAHGHARTQILDCSRAAWQGHGYPVTSTPSQPVRSSYRLAAPDPRLGATRAQVREAIGVPSTTLLDVRTRAEYDGERFWPSGGMDPNGRAGHVPSAVHQPMAELLDQDGRFLPEDDLRHVFAGIDLDGPTELITYCTVGGRATAAWFALTQLLGRDHVRVYDGSWAEWGRTSDAPVATLETLV
ncbi:sulfurtransferase [Sinomonas sp. P10A9]|uniref:Sulfurtransferase n=1 Tax=Sinomonas puerhi TaxID=3238584 RepID=A0AB39L1E2_9MICC